MGWMLAGGFAAGLSLRVADLLGTPVPDEAAAAARSGSAGLLVPLPYFWAAVGGAALAVAVAWVALRLVLRARRLGRRQQAEVAELYGVADDPRGPRWPRVVQIARARGRAMASDDAERYAAHVHAGTLALVFAGTAVYLRDPRLPLADRVSPVTTFGTLVLGGFALALLLLGRQAYRNAQLRRTVGILWDLATFWPRASHPLAPPCYCERALPDLICRIRAAAPTGDRRIVLSAHSQGTVIAAALVLQLEDDERERIRLVTYGSPLRRLYAGAFPVWFGPATLEMLGRRQHRQPRARPDVGLALAQPVPPHRPDRRLGGRRPARRLVAGGRLAAGRPGLRPAARRHPAAAHPRALRLPRGPGLRGRRRHGPPRLVGQYGMRKCLRAIALTGGLG